MAGPTKQQKQQNQRQQTFKTSTHPGCGLALILATVLVIMGSSLVGMFLFWR